MEIEGGEVVPTFTLIILQLAVIIKCLVTTMACFFFCGLPLYLLLYFELDWRSCRAGIAFDHICFEPARI